MGRHGRLRSLTYTRHSRMDEVAVNRSFFVGFDRTNDLLTFIEDTPEGEAEIVGVFIACATELSNRWDMSEREAIRHVLHVVPED